MPSPLLTEQPGETFSQNKSKPLGRPLDVLRGVGPSFLAKLDKLNIQTVEDLLFTLPTRYEDRRQLRPLDQLRIGFREIFVASVLASGEKHTARGRKLFEVIVGDKRGRQVSLRWFHYRLPWMRKNFMPGRQLLAIGEVKHFGSQREVHHPEVEFVDTSADIAQSNQFGHILPVYPLTEGITQKQARKIWRSAVEQYAETIDSAVPPEILRRYSLLPLAEALRLIHCPKDDADFLALESGTSLARRSVVFDEFFILQLGLALKQQGLSRETAQSFSVTHRYTKPLAAMLPYRLTSAQRRVLGEIKQDLMQPHPMNRLVQGDVGSGKTVVALMSALLAIENGFQVAVVAPTEILAEQHYLQFHPWFERLGLSITLLTGAISPKEKRLRLENVRNGDVDLLVGTHAVLQEGVEFKHLALGIIDEQHRFGVRQRAHLRQKGESPHILVMTATPIPRTLSLTVYGDLALSVIDELPPGRAPVVTHVIGEEGRAQVYCQMRQALEHGQQAYVVFPLVEESEKSDLRAADSGALQIGMQFPQYRVAVLHGRLRPDEKEQVMVAFKAKEVDILVATTVIEVGVDVPNATIMVVEHAERFGLAQLHQLRGRVGRGEGGGHCYLFKQTPCSQDAEDRLNVMAQTNDGFRIAEADLRIRGPGEFLGTKQAGLPDLRVANLMRDGRILDEARRAAFELAASPELLAGEDYAVTRRVLQDRWGTRLELASIG